MASVPISNSALSWAVNESGFSTEQIDEHLDVKKGSVESWIAGDDLPNATQFKNLKSLLQRPAALFFMDTPPSTTTESMVTMRYALGAENRSRSPKERVAIRDAARVRRFVRDLLDDLGNTSREMPSASTNEDPEVVANTVRSDFVKVPIEEQMTWSSPASAFREWRTVLEGMDILVFLYPLGREAARGFSFANEHPPVIGISTTWNASVRIYSLFHELGHVLTRTSSSCFEATSSNPTTDPTERWCEKFAASFLMPKQTFEDLTDHSPYSNSIQTATWLSNKLCVSRKAALLRMVETGYAEWRDFRELDSRSEYKSGGGRPTNDELRTRDVIRSHTYGRCLSTVKTAFQAKIVSEADIRTFLRMLPDELR